MSVPWTDENTELLRTLWANGKSCRLIAAEIGGGCSRNAVIGKVHRLGLDKRDERGNIPRRPAFCEKLSHVNGGNVISSIRARQRRERKISDSVGDNKMKRVIIARARAIGELPQFEAVGVHSEPESRRRVRLLDLHDWHCRYIPGEVGIEPQFCGVPIECGSYCRKHADICYAGLPDR